MNKRIRIILAHVAIGLAILGGSAWSCSTTTDAPTSSLPQKKSPMARLADCGQGCHLVEFHIDLTDADGHIIPLSEGWEVDYSVTSYQLGPNGTGVPAPLIDVDSGIITETPYTRSYHVPNVVYEIAPANVVGMYVTIDMTMDVGWTIKCTVLEGDVLVDEDDASVDLPLDGGAGLPQDRHLILTWPTDFAIPGV